MGGNELIKHLAKLLFCPVFRLSLNPALLFPLSHFNSPWFHHTFHSDPSYPSEMQWSTHSSLFLSFLASSSSLDQVLHRTLGVSLPLDGSSMSCSPLEHPSFIRSASFLPRDHLQSCPQQNTLPHSSSFFSKPASLLTSSWLIFWVSSCVSSHISYSCVSCPQQLPSFLKHTWAEAPRAPLAGWTFEAQWTVAIRVIWKQLWLAQGSSWPPSTQTFCSLCYQTQPFIPNTETWKLKWCIFWMLHLLCFHNPIDTCMNADFVYNLYKNWAQIHFIISLLCCSYLVYTNI